MSTKKKMLEAAAGAAGGEATYVEDVFSTYLYTGNGSTQTITNGIDLDGEGGLVWAMCRTNNNDHYLFDTERPYDDPPTAWYEINSNNTNAQAVNNGILSMNSDGYSMRFNNDINASGEDYVSWTFRKAPGFFDIVTWTGNATIREISHNLGCVPGMIIVKVLSVANPWAVYHKGVDSTAPEDFFLSLNRTDSKVNSAGYWNDTAPTATEFTIGATSDVNASGQTYVAYLFADGDDAAAQIFGTDGDQAVVKCGSYTGNGSTTGPEIDCGFEPQWVLVKNTTSAASWNMFDTMRGLATGSGDTLKRLYADTSGAENASKGLEPTSTGFKLTQAYSGINASSSTYIYIAIRRPHKPAESGTEVFAIDTMGGTSSSVAFYSGFTTDAALYKRYNATGSWVVASRLTGLYHLESNSTNAETSNGTIDAWDYMDGYNNYALNSNYYSWMFKRSPGFFDVVCYTGTGALNQTINHNLGVIPELAIFKSRTYGYDWPVKYAGTWGTNTAQILNYPIASQSNVNYGATATSTTITLNTGGSQNNEWNRSGAAQVVYLFATLPGVSKVGSYTGNGTSQTIDCGFSSGARFVLIKRTDSPGDWHVWDSERGIVAGNDPFLELNTTNAENTSYDSVDPYSAGFTVNEDAGTAINTSGGSYIYLAIA